CLMRRKFFLLCLLSLLSACNDSVPPQEPDDGFSDEQPDTGAAAASPAPGRPADYVGSRECAGCHQGEYERWQGSHHDLAMQEVSDETVLGDFNEAGFVYFGTESLFYRDGERFMVRTDGPDGQLQDFEITYTFGVAPLQQY